MRGIKWSDETLNSAVELLNNGKNFKEIGILMNISQVAVTSKLGRAGYKSPYIPIGSGVDKGKTKYVDLDWNEIQKEYDNGSSYDDIRNFFNLSTRAISWGRKNRKLFFRTASESLKLARKRGKYKEITKSEYVKYRSKCEFTFSLNDYPDKFDFTLIEIHGWYKAKNRGNIPNGVNRDHMYSVKEGYDNNIEPYIISHPANCQLLLHRDNVKKNIKCCITLDELLERIEKWNNKYCLLVHW